jgi:hypothetical protein
VITIYSYQIIERIVEFSRHQIMDVMSACDPAYRAFHKPNDNGTFEGRSSACQDVTGLFVPLQNFLCNLLVANLLDK